MVALSPLKSLSFILNVANEVLCTFNLFNFFNFSFSNIKESVGVWYHHSKAWLKINFGDQRMCIFLVETQLGKNSTALMRRMINIICSIFQNIGMVALIEWLPSLTVQVCISCNIDCWFRRISIFEIGAFYTLSSVL